MGKKANINHILIIRLSAMGDVAMLVPCVLALTEKYPLLNITILTRERFMPIFENIPRVSFFSAEVKTKHKGILGLYRLYKQLSALQIDAVADTHNVLRSSILKLFFKVRGILFVQVNKGRKEKKLLVQEKDKVFKPLKTTHQRYADVFKRLGFPITLLNDNVLVKVALPKRILPLVNESESLVAIAPFAAYKSKMYPLILMEEVIKKISQYSNVKILLLGGGKKEVEILDKIAEKLGDNVVNVSGRLSFEQELALISNLRVMLSMDSGNGHLAANYGIPVITLWGVTHPYAGFAPFGQSEENSLCADRSQYPLIPTSVYGNKFPAGYDKAMESISPDDVYQKVVSVLEKND
ncbi:glycosyltransferase family 9 protein [Croceitalea rosinachiae]|uniref:Glycosyltransferase family 9 protein n=1 Tax=Croceitalea rosinachiae TaxID=3075596 RepID=A0ABU3A7S6_9FLAO|nr:glycosyltransferase family 9 protein [Croceitalea sp. F388]MDT0606232.1 glycosyltransferase family 9 protein [Croceitalea sp. F388]